MSRLYRRPGPSCALAVALVSGCATAPFGGDGTTDPTVDGATRDAGDGAPNVPVGGATRDAGDGAPNVPVGGATRDAGDASEGRDAASDVQGVPEQDSGATTDGALDGSEGHGTLDDGGDGAPPTCSIVTGTTLPGVEYRFPNPRCRFTLAEARAGLTIPYELVVSKDVTGLEPVSQDWGQCGYVFFEEMSGNGQLYCLCDVGYCGMPASPLSLSPAVLTFHFLWSGQNWTGPSDIAPPRPEGPSFPPGTYTLTVSLVGTQGLPNNPIPMRIFGELLITLVP
jgi:hypothetical protein